MKECQMEIEQVVVAVQAILAHSIGGGRVGCGVGNQIGGVTVGGGLVTS